MEHNIFKVMGKTPNIFPIFYHFWSSNYAQIKISLKIQPIILKTKFNRNGQLLLVVVLLVVLVDENHLFLQPLD